MRLFQIENNITNIYPFRGRIENEEFVEHQEQPAFSLPEGYGPRHMAFHPGKGFVYILNETHSSVTACSYDTASGVMQQIQDISMLPEGYADKTNAAAIRIHPNGKFLYASNRGHNSIAVYEISEDGKLVFVEHETEGVNFPRDFNISPNGKWMIIANQKGASIMSVRIDDATGELTNSNNTFKIQSPLAIEFLAFPGADTDTTGSVLTVDADAGMFSIYPNPATDDVRIEASGSGMIRSLELYNQNGQRLKKYSNIHETTLDVTGLAGGQYLLLGSDGIHTVCRSIIIL
jgi:DNA-binding beta-propeller fold protein YncE